MRRSLLCLFLLLVAAPAARADDTYTVDSCATAGGAAATTAGWTASNSGNVALRCPRPGISASEPPGSTPQLGGFNLTFTAPAPARIAGYRLWRSAELAAGWNYTLYRRAPSGREEEIVERCWTMSGCAAIGNDNLAGPPHVREAGIDIPALVLHVDCNPGPCSGGGPSYVKASRLQVDLSDRIDPTL